MVYLLLADGFEEIEALTPVDYLRRAGIDIKTVGINKKNVLGAHKIEVIADLLLEEIPQDDPCPKMIILPGGLEGVKGIENDKRAMEMIEKTVECNGYIAAICAAPTILAGMGLLKGKRAVCYPGMEDILIEAGALLSGRGHSKAVIEDDKIITARAAGVSDLFAFKIIEILKGEDSMRAVKKAVHSYK